jgi:hypothetical protein
MSPGLNFPVLKVNIPRGYEEDTLGTIAGNSPIYVWEQNVEIKVTGRECDGIAANSKLIFCQVYDTRTERLCGADW